MTASRPSFTKRVALRIAQTRVRLGLTQEALGARLDIAMKNVQRIESGNQNLTLQTVERIAKVMRVAPETFFLSSQPGPHRGPLPAYRSLEQAGFTLRAATRGGRRADSFVPIVNLRAAAGNWGDPRASEIAAWVSIDRHVGDKQLFVSAIVGTSMEPTVRNGAFVLFRRTELPPVPGAIYLFEYAASADAALTGPYVLKRFGAAKKLRNGKVRVVLESTNQIYPPLVLDIDDLSELRVIGELVEVLT